MTIHQMNQALREYRVPKEILHKFPSVKNLCSLGNDGEVKEVPNNRFDYQLVAAQK